jgi:hypothetical protein
MVKVGKMVSWVGAGGDGCGVGVLVGAGNSVRVAVGARVGETVKDAEAVGARVEMKFWRGVLEGGGADANLSRQPVRRGQNSVRTMNLRKFIYDRMANIRFYFRMSGM